MTNCSTLQLWSNLSLLHMIRLLHMTSNCVMWCNFDPHEQDCSTWTFLLYGQCPHRPRQISRMPLLHPWYDMIWYVSYIVTVLLCLNDHINIHNPYLLFSHTKLATQLNPLLAAEQFIFLCPAGSHLNLLFLTRHKTDISYIDLIYLLASKTPSNSKICQPEKEERTWSQVK